MSFTGTTAVALGESAAAGQCTGVHRSVGGWSLVDPPAFPESPVPDIGGFMNASTMVGDDPRTLLASDGGAVYRSADGGCTWRMVFAVTVQDYPDSNLGAYVVSRIVAAHAAVPASKQTVYLLLTPNGMFQFTLVTLFGVAPPEVVAVSHDGGRTFSIVQPKPTADEPYVPGCNVAPDGAAVASENPKSIFLHCTGGAAQDEALKAKSGGVGLYHSVDGGASWSLVGMPFGANVGSLTAGRTPHSLWLAGQALDPAGSGSQFVAAWHSTDDAAHWSLIFPGGQTGAGLTPSKLVLGPGSARAHERVLVYNAVGVYDSDDGGRAWTTLRPPSSKNGEFPTSSAFFARGAIFIFQSADACPQPARFFRYRKASAPPKLVAIPTQWGVVHSWGSSDYWGTDFAVGAHGTTALAPTSICKSNATTYLPPSFLAYRAGTP